MNIVHEFSLEASSAVITGRALLNHDSRDTYVDDGTDEFARLVQRGKEPAPRPSSVANTGCASSAGRCSDVISARLHPSAGMVPRPLYPTTGRYVLTEIGINVPLASGARRPMTSPGSVISKLSIEELKRLHPSSQAAHLLDAEHEDCRDTFVQALPTLGLASRGRTTACRPSCFLPWGRIRHRSQRPGAADTDADAGPVRAWHRLRQGLRSHHECR